MVARTSKRPARKNRQSGSEAPFFKGLDLERLVGVCPFPVGEAEKQTFVTTPQTFNVGI